LCQSSEIQFDYGKPKSYDNDALARQALGWIQSFDVLWGEKLVF